MTLFSKKEKKEPTDRDKAEICYKFYMFSIIIVGLCFIFSQWMYALAFIVVGGFLSNCSCEFELRYLRSKVQ